MPISNPADSFMNSFSRMMAVGESNMNIMLRVHEMNAQSDRDKANERYRQNELALQQAQFEERKKTNKLNEKQILSNALGDFYTRQSDVIKEKNRSIEKMVDYDKARMQNFASLGKMLSDDTQRGTTYAENYYEGPDGGKGLDPDLAIKIDRWQATPPIVTSLDQFKGMATTEALASKQKSFRVGQLYARNNEELQSLARSDRKTMEQIWGIETNNDELFISETVKARGQVDKIGKPSDVKRIPSDSERAHWQELLQQEGKQGGIIAMIDQAYEGLKKNDPQVAADVRAEVLEAVRQFNTARDKQDAEVFKSLIGRVGRELSGQFYPQFVSFVRDLSIPKEAMEHADTLGVWWKHKMRIFEPLEKLNGLSQVTKCLMHDPGSGDAYANAKNMREILRDPARRKVIAGDMMKSFIVLNPTVFKTDDERKAAFEIIHMEQVAAMDNQEPKSGFGRATLQDGTELPSIEKIAFLMDPSLLEGKGAPIDTENSKAMDAVRSGREIDAFGSVYSNVRAFQNMSKVRQVKDDELGEWVNAPSLLDGQVADALDRPLKELLDDNGIKRWKGILSQEWGRWGKLERCDHANCMVSGDAIADHVVGSAANAGHVPLVTQEGVSNKRGWKISVADLSKSAATSVDFFTRSFPGITPKGWGGKTPIPSVVGYGAMTDTIISEIQSNGNIGEAVGRWRFMQDEMASRGMLVQLAGVQREIEKSCPGLGDAMKLTMKASSIKKAAVQKLQMAGSEKEKEDAKLAIKASEKIAESMLVNMRWNGSRIEVMPSSESRKASDGEISGDIEKNGPNGNGWLLGGWLGENKHKDAVARYYAKYPQAIPAKGSTYFEYSGMIAEEIGNTPIGPLAEKAAQTLQEFGFSTSLTFNELVNDMRTRIKKVLSDTWKLTPESIQYLTTGGLTPAELEDARNSGTILDAFRFPQITP